MATTPRFPRDPEDHAGLRHAGRILWPEKSAQTLPPTKGARRPVERDALTEEEEEEEEGDEDDGNDAVKVRLGMAGRRGGSTNVRLAEGKTCAGDR